MKLYNFEIQGFVNFLMSEELNGKQSRMRARFCKLASERLKEIEDERISLIKQYAEKDENGEPKVETNEQGSTYHPLEDSQAFYKEYAELMDEEFIIDDTDERKDMLETVRGIVLESKQTFKGESAIVYERYCELVEEIKYSS